MSSFLFLLGVAAFFSKPAMAYVDPGSGYYLFQLLIAVAAGGLYYVAKLPKKILKRFRRKAEEPSPASTTPDSNRKAA